MRISDWSSDVCSSDLFAIRPDFHPGHHEAVGELPGPESCHRGQYDARHLSEHGFISALPAPVLRRRQLHDDKAHEGHEQGGGKTCPNAPPRPSIAIYFGKDVPNDVADREKEDTRAKRPLPYPRQIHHCPFARTEHVR